MIGREHDLPITRQVETLNVSRGSVCYRPRPVPEADCGGQRRRVRNGSLTEPASDRRKGIGCSRHSDDFHRSVNTLPAMAVVRGGLSPE
jgi:hypothetical protein